MAGKGYSSGSSRSRICEVCGARESKRPGFYATFPIDEVRCRNWVQLVGNEDLVHVPIEMLHKLRHICGDHFERRDFGKSGNKLKKRACPKLHLTAPPLSDEQLSEFPQHFGSQPEIKEQITITHSTHDTGQQQTEEPSAIDDDFAPPSPVPEVEAEAATTLFSWQKSESIPAVDVEQPPAVSELEEQTGVSLYCVDTPAQVVPQVPKASVKEVECEDCRRIINGFQFWCVQCVDCALCGACEARGRHKRHYVLRAPTDSPYRQTQVLVAAIRHRLNENLLTQLEPDDGMKPEVKDEPPEEDCIVTPETRDDPLDAADPLRPEPATDEPQHTIAAEEITHRPFKRPRFADYIERHFAARGGPLPVKLTSGTSLQFKFTNGTPLPVKVTSGTPLSAKLTSGTPLPVKLTSRTPLSAKLTSGTSLPVKVTSGTPLSAKLTSGTPLPVKLTSGTPLSAKLTLCTPLPVKLTSGMPVPVKLTSGTPLPVKLTSGTPLPVKLTSGTPLSAKLTPGTTLPVKLTSGTPHPVKLTSGTPLSTKLTPGTALPVKLTSGTPLSAKLTPGKHLPVKLTSGTPLPVKLTSGTPLPVKLTSGTHHPVKLTSGTPLPVKLTSGTPLPVKLTSGTHHPVKLASGTHHPVKLASGTPCPVKLTSGTPRPVKLTSGKPRPVQLTSGTPRPVKLKFINLDDVQDLDYVMDESEADELRDDEYTDIQMLDDDIDSVDYSSKDDGRKKSRVVEDDADSTDDTESIDETDVTRILNDTPNDGVEVLEDDADSIGSRVEDEDDTDLVTSINKTDSVDRIVEEAESILGDLAPRRGVRREEMGKLLARGLPESMVRGLSSEAVVELRPLSSVEIRKWTADSKKRRK